MAKKRWRIKNTGEGVFSLSRGGAFLRFNEIRESNINWDFYYGGRYVGTLFKTENRIMNLDDFAEKIR